VLLCIYFFLLLRPDWASKDTKWQQCGSLLLASYGNSIYLMITIKKRSLFFSINGSDHYSIFWQNELFWVYMWGTFQIFEVLNHKQIFGICSVTLLAHDSKEYVPWIIPGRWYRSSSVHAWCPLTLLVFQHLACIQWLLLLLFHQSLPCDCKWPCLSLRFLDGLACWLLLHLGCIVWSHSNVWLVWSAEIAIFYLKGHCI